MPECTIREIYKSPWGIVAGRREDVERASYGGFSRIVREETEKQFMSIDAVAEAMDASESTARRWIRKLDPRYITQGQKTLYLRGDVEVVCAARSARRRATEGGE